jgi:multidrug efflux system membrane fusion protein
MKTLTITENRYFRKTHEGRMSTTPVLRSEIRRRAVRFMMLFFFVLLLLETGCSREEQKRPQPLVPVKIAEIITLDVPIRLSTVGTVEAYSTVKVTSRVSGLVIGQHVKEGQFVEKGQLLFTIDDEPYQTILASARSNLERDCIKLEKARKDAARYADLLKKDYVTREQAEQIQADSNALEAVIKGDEAALENAKLNVSYCRITAPIGGKAGAVLIHEGNLVKENDGGNPIMIINQLTPVFVRFAVPEQYLTEIKFRMAEHDLEVQATAAGQEGKINKGRLTFLDNAIQADSGTIDLKAIFENSDSSLWPGMFINVVLVLGTRSGAVASPVAAVQMGQDGAYVFVLKNDMTVELRQVTAGEQSGNYVVIESGLSPDETVVTDGQLMLFPGAKVTVTNESEPPLGEKRS